ncbi:MAG: IS110 family transposase, partial [Planctomycetota bacterium]
ERITQSAAGIENWIAKKRKQAGNQPIAIIYESCRNGFMQSLILREGITLFPVNPKQFAKYRESYHNAGSKDDRTDARLLARMLRERIHTLKPLQLSDEQTRKLDHLCRNRRQLVNRRTESIVRLKCYLKASFPLFLELKLSLNAMLALLARWPDPRKIKRAQKSLLVKVLRQSGTRNQSKIDSIVDAIKSSKLLTLDPAIHDSMAPMFQLESKIIKELNKSIKQLEDSIETLFNQHQDARLFNKLPGAGKVLAPRLLAAFGSNRERFESANEISSWSGIAPITKQSGKSKVVVKRNACSKYLRQTFHEFADFARVWCPWSKAYYQMQRNGGMKHNAAVRKLALRWIRILFRVWKDNQPYDQEKYLAVIAKKNTKINNFLNSKSLELAS